ncbi:MAG: hypothetical protein NC040_01895 [Muribaculaceae bacterium]|nr:hypothetical protein [Alistipes senegalensis]MCM1472781.1 hypothetical protein [Muribaculaceae bacterium]
MKILTKYAACLLACMTFTAVTGCEGKTSEDSQTSVISDVTTTTTTNEIVPEETTTTVPEEIPTEDTTEIPVENAVDYMSILNAYHQAYIDGNADAVYVLFCPDEITAFDSYMKEYLKNNLGESETVIEDMFSKENIMSAINGSIDNIHDIMDNYNQTASDPWSISIAENTIEHYSADELAQINANLGMNITDGYMCEIPFYKNDINEETFVAEPASVFEINGNWYISYSVACDRLVEFMDIDF